jgi:hypothetical protein
MTSLPLHSITEGYADLTDVEATAMRGRWPGQSRAARVPLEANRGGSMDACSHCLDYSGGHVPPNKDDLAWQLASMFVLFNTLVVRDRIPVEAAIWRSSRSDEYRRAISPDTPGADLD